MGATVRWDGLDELRADLRQLPKELADEGGAIVLDAGTRARDEVVAAYSQHRHSGNLASHVKLTIAARGSFGAAVVVRSTARHASIFEYGSQARHTALGANRGSMPPANIFIPIMTRRRRDMYERLKALISAKGLTVSGDADR